MTCSPTTRGTAGTAASKPATSTVAGWRSSSVHPASGACCAPSESSRALRAGHLPGRLSMKRHASMLDLSPPTDNAVFSEVVELISSAWYP